MAFLRLQQLFIALLACCTSLYVSHAYTYEPPGKDPISLDKVRNSEVATRLTADNFDELTAGKLVFIKFYSPSCPHCKSMAPDWNKLATYYQDLPDSDNILIGSIDCTDAPAGKKLCARFKIMGLPTLLYGDAGFGGIYLEEFGGDEKTFTNLKSWATEKLVPTCNPGKLDACSSTDRHHMENALAMSYNGLDNLIKMLEKKEEDLKTTYKDAFAELQKKYDALVTEKEMKATQTKGSVKLINEVIEKKKLV